MRKRIAVFANGWGCEYLREIVTGVFEVAKDHDMDVFSFVDFSIMTDNADRNRGEINIFRLPDLSDFDGAIVLANSFNMKEEEEYVFKQVLESGIPAVSLEYNYKGVTSIESDNYAGMYELATHILEDHKAKEIVFVGGPATHPESNMRLAAVSTAAKAHGVDFTKENILFGDWAKNLAIKLFGDWLEEHGHLPDAILCANDVMAIGLCEYLDEKGYVVPDDVIITGYDCTMRAQNFHPRIASVSHEWSVMGKRAIDILLDKMNGKEIYEVPALKTKFIKGGSCGCGYDINAINMEISKGRKRNFNTLENSLLDSHFRHIYLALRDVRDSQTLYKAFSKLFEEEHWLEGKNLNIGIDKEFFRIVPDNANLKDVGYSDTLELVCSLKDGETTEYRTLTSKEILFKASNEASEPGIYICIPIHNEGKTYGFAVMARDINIILDNVLYSWTRHMDQYLEQVRLNITIDDLNKQLTKMSVTDVLTEVYNRAGCEKIAYPLLEDLRKAGKTGVIMIADIDKMKLINDNFGHFSGDLAIRTVAAVLKRNFPEDWVIARYGGDEFLVAGDITSCTEVEGLIGKVTDDLADEVKKQNIKFNLTVSMGYSVLEPEDKIIDVEKSLQKADKLMYEVKKEHHAAIDYSKL